MSLILKPLKRSFFAQDPVRVAQQLLGNYLVRKMGEKILVGKIVETESYLGFDDEASHSYKGKTQKNKSMYLEAGHAYVYAMRQWNLVNVSTESRDIPSAVLIRAIEPVQGLELMRRHRMVQNDIHVGSGPGKVCQAMQIDKSFDGVDMTHSSSALFIAQANKKDAVFVIQKSSRIGISKAVDKVLRFWIQDNLHITKHRFNNIQYTV